MVSLDVTWEEFLKIVREEAGNQVVETWFKAVTFERFESASATVHLAMPNQFVQSWIRDNYNDLLKRHLTRLLNAETIQLRFRCIGQATKHTATVVPATAIKPTPATPHSPARTTASIVGTARTSLVRTPSHADPDRATNQKAGSISIQFPSRKSLLSTPKATTGLRRTSEDGRRIGTSSLNSAYHFDDFVVGPSNSLAHAAAYAVSQSLGRVYNPLFIYGGTGLGKTHLLHAIGNEHKRINPDARVGYETSDRFMTGFVNAIRFDKIHHFRERYRRLDLLLMDDVQFFTNKEQTQETFFHIFNTLYEQKKQIILSSDTYPREIAGLQSRLKSRMGWGLVVDIQVPDLETKIAILTKKADANEIALDNDVASYIASRIVSNIRELEGALIRVGAFASLTNSPLTVDLAKRVLLNVPEEKKEGVMLAKVLSIVTRHYGLSSGDIKSKKRSKQIASVRHVAFYFMKQHAMCSLQAIGSFIGGRDHSTVIHAIDKMEKKRETDPLFDQELRSIEQEILSS